MLRPADQPSEQLIVLLAMSQEQILVNRVEPHNSLPRNPAVHAILIATVTEDSLDEVLPERRITEAPFLLDGNQRKLPDKGQGK